MKFNKMLHQYMEDFTQGSVEGILYSIITEASEFFAECPGDFCVQHVTDTVIIFGSTNRIVWRPATGFAPDVMWCNAAFLKHFKTVQKGPFV
jgi:hypothetical protein